MPLIKDNKVREATTRVERSGARKRNRDSMVRGSAIIEMIAIIPLMILFMLFTIIVCRWLVYQGRILAAGRTAAWLVAYADDQSGADGIVQGVDFAKDLRRWHFIDDGPNEGVVMVRAPVRAGGLLATTDIEDIMDTMQSLGQENIEKKNNESDADKYEYDSTKGVAYERVGYESDVADVKDSEEEQAKETNKTMSQSGGIVGKFIEGVVQFLTDDFKRVEVKVDYWMPLPFNLGAFERLLGAPVDRGGPAPPGSSQAFEAMSPGGTKQYALLTRGTHTTCVLPVLDPGRSGGLTDALDNAVKAVESLLETLEKAISTSKDKTLYRPMLNYADTPEPSDNTDDDAVDQPAFYALLVYELWDDEHTKARP